MISSPGRIGVAISTTGDQHRLALLRECVRHWDAHLPMSASLFVTVDGDEDAAQRARAATEEWTGSVFRVGQPRWAVSPFNGKMGVAVNKNTGLELLMDNTPVEHLFLSDDDVWPLFPQSITKHIETPLMHSMVCWGKSRFLAEAGRYARWSWPRGVMLYTHRTVVAEIGGMDERFGPGGHEHVEWSQRIHNAEFTPTPFGTPTSYATRGATGASALWHCEDMRKPGETLDALGRRRKALTSVQRTGSDWTNIHKIMEEREGSADFVPYDAHSNGRASATLCVNPTSRGAGGEK